MQGLSYTIAEHMDDGWRYIVEYIHGADMYTYRVTLTKEYAGKVFPGLEPEQILEKTFHFLLQREPASAILSEFDVRQVTQYFPDFEMVVTETA